MEATPHSSSPVAEGGHESQQAAAETGNQTEQSKKQETTTTIDAVADASGSAATISSTTVSLSGAKSARTSSSSAPSPKRQQTYEGMPVPRWFKPSSAKVFRELPVRDDDILLITYVKAGTTWAWKILQCLLRLDDDGKFAEGTPYSSQHAQIYFCALPQHTPEEPHEVPVFGKACYEDLINQPSPRLFVTHNLPHVCPKGFGTKGRVIYMQRDPRDALVSLYYMNGVPADGWDGAFRRFTDPDCSNAFGSFWSHVLSTEPFLKSLGDRARTVYYEDLCTNFDREIKQLANLLDITMTPKKMQKLKELTDINTMKKGNTLTVRKGGSGAWRNHFSEEQVVIFDELLAKTVGNSSIMKRYLSSKTLSDV